MRPEWLTAGSSSACQEAADCAPRADCAPQADCAPRRRLCTRLLQDLQLTASALYLPRVHAADGASPSAPAPTQTPSLILLPRGVGKTELPDTGWDRIKDLFDRGEMQVAPEEVTGLVKSAFLAAVVGMFYGGLPAARHARERFIQLNQAQIYRSRVEAVRAAHGAAIRGFVRYGWRWSWRITVFVTLFNTVNTGLSVYRDKYALSHYAAAGAVTGGLFRLIQGLRGLLAGAAIGGSLGLPAGALMMALQGLSGETSLDRRRRERRELYQLKLEEWTARLQLTDDLIGDLSGAAQAQAANQDLQKVEELLSLPRNEGVAQDSLPADSPPGDSLPGPGDSLPGDSLPGPGDSLPGPGDSLPGDSLPGPGDSLPGDSLPGPADSLPGDSLPAQDCLR